MDVTKPIRTEVEYQTALREIDLLFDAAPNTPEEDHLELLAILVEAYEAEHYPILPPDPIDAILHVMDAYQLDEQDLVTFIGSQKQVSEILNRRKPLTLPMIRKLHEGLGIPAEILIYPSLEMAA
jgi:HTH-type transcriptional regulator/antitoxin HigA